MMSIYHKSMILAAKSRISIFNYLYLLKIRNLSNFTYKKLNPPFKSLVTTNINILKFLHNNLHNILTGRSKNHEFKYSLILLFLFRSLFVSFDVILSSFISHIARYAPSSTYKSTYERKTKINSTYF